MARAIGPSVLPCPQVIFPSKTLVFWNLFEFSVAEITKKNQYLPHSESKSYQIKSIKSCPSRSFQEHQRHVPIPPKFSASEKKINQYSRTFATQVQTSWNQAHASLLVKSFPKTQRTRSEASQFSRSHNYKTKQTTFLHRLIGRALCHATALQWLAFL